MNSVAPGGDARNGSPAGDVPILIWEALDAHTSAVSALTRTHSEHSRGRHLTQLGTQV